jgi:hypothetical protein
VIINQIVRDVEENIIGRVANRIGSRRTQSTEIALEFVEKAGGGNHLEIGTLFGGSAIAVALLKQRLNHSGIVFCIDPLNGYYNDGSKGFIDNQSGKAVTPEVLFENIRRFDVGQRMVVMQAKSVPCPNLMDIKFSTAYIDGEHESGVPLKDWICIKDIVTRFVIFDNYADTHPDVQNACLMARNDPDWREVYDEDITYVVERSYE